MFKIIRNFIRDFIVYIIPFSFYKQGQYRYGFLAHPRNLRDVERKFPFFKFLPINIQHLILRKFCPPVVVSRIKGLKSLETGEEIDGFIFSIPLLPDMMRENRELALKKIINAVRFAKKYGVKIISLGGLTSSYSYGGLRIVERVRDISITTGHAYTAYNVTKNLFQVYKMLGLDKEKVLVAIVGAAGSIGSTSAKLIAREGFKNILLVDLPRKASFFNDLVKEMLVLNPLANVHTSHQIQDIKKADFIITATNAPEATIRNRDLKAGAVIIDDAQPSDVSPEVLRNENVLVLEAGVVKTPGIHSHFDFNLKDKDDNFSCMAEVFALASNGWRENFVLGRTNVEQVDKIAEIGKALGFRLADFQNFNEKIKESRILRIKEIIHKSNV